MKGKGSRGVGDLEEAREGEDEWGRRGGDEGGRGLE